MEAGWPRPPHAGSVHGSPDPDTGRCLSRHPEPTRGAWNGVAPPTPMQRSFDSSSALFIKKLSMPGDITRMRPIILSCRKCDSFAQPAKNFQECRRNLICRHQQLIFIRKGYKVPVEQPMYGGSKCNSVLHHVRPAVGHRPNMSALHLRLASMVKQHKACDCATIFVRFANQCSEICFPNDAAR